MPAQRSLKSKNVPILITFAIWCLALYIVFLTGTGDFWSRLVSLFRDLSAEDGVVVVMAPILVFVLTSIISSDNKARIVFWRRRHALPGHRCLSELAPKDPRIDMQALEDRLGSLPSDPRMQNTKWYELSRRCAGLPRVEEAHREFLLARDLCAVSLVVSVVGPLSVFVLQRSVLWALLYLLVMALHYLAFAVTARNKGNRFACNVLVEALLDRQSTGLSNADHAF
jgi:hypothetical protein